LPFGLIGGDRRFELRCGDFSRVGLEDARLRLDDLAQRPEGDPLAVGQTAALPPVDQLGLCVDVREQLGGESALPHTRLANDRDQLHRALLRRPLERPDQKRFLELAADERRLVLAGAVPSEPVADRRCTPERKRLRLSLHGDRRQRLVLEHVAGRSIGLLADRDPVHRRRALDASGGVDDVAGDDPLSLLGAGAERHHRLARVDPDSYLRAEIRIRLVQLRDRFQDSQSRPHRSFGVVLVRHRRATYRHHRVTDELFDRAAVTLDLFSQACVVGTDASAHVLRILLLGGGGESHQVTEEDGDDLPLLDHGPRLGGQRSRAVAAESKPVRVLLPAARTNDHAAESV
jgi:hypothetical protein